MTDTDLARLLGNRYIERRDVKAWQFAGGGYHPERTPITMKDLADHISGRKTMGHYLTSPENRCRVFVFDIDLPKEMTIDGVEVHPREEFLNEASPYRQQFVCDLIITAEILARRTRKETGLPVAISYSGSKGLHVTAFTGSESGEVVRGLALEVLKATDAFVPLRGEHFFRHKYPDIAVELEVYPKQAKLDGKELGNLVRLPLGIHRKTLGMSYFLRLASPRSQEFQPMDAMDALNGKLPW